MHGHGGCQRKAFGLKDQVDRNGPTISAAQRVIAGRVGRNLEGQVRILNLHLQRFFFGGQPVDSSTLKIGSLEVIIAARNGQPEATNFQWLGYGQRLRSQKTVSLESPGDFRSQTGIDKISGLGARNNPTSPDRGHALAISSRPDLICSIRGSDGLATFQLQKWNKARIDFLHGLGKTGKSIRRGLIVRGRRFRSGHERQGEMEMTFADDPNAKLAAGSIAKILKTSNVAEAWLRRKSLHAFPFESFHEHVV